MDAPVTTLSKEDLRAQFRTRRRALAESSQAARSSLIVHRALGVPALSDAGVVHAYWPLVERGEIDTRPLIAALRSWGAEVVLPVVTSFDPKNPTLEHRRYGGPDSLERNRWGIREPVDTARVSPESIDAVVVPALGAGRNGHRIGHGSGYYDAFLQSTSCPRIALVYDSCFVPTVPSASHDVRMTTVVTETNVHEIDEPS